MSLSARDSCRREYISFDEADSGARLEKMKRLAKGHLPSEYYKGLEYDNQQ